MDFHCIGGFVVSTKYGFSSRTTFDLDVLAITPNVQRKEFLQAADESSELHRKYGLYLDLVTATQAYPENYGQRPSEMFAGELRRI